MIKPSSLLFVLYPHGYWRRKARKSLYRYERTARQIGVSEAVVYEAYMNAFAITCSSATFCRLLLDGRLDKTKLAEWGREAIIPGHTPIRGKYIPLESGGK